MNDESQNRYALNQAILAIHGRAYFWRPELDQIESDLTAGTVSRSDATRKVSWIIDLVRSSERSISEAIDPETKVAVLKYLELGVEEAAERAERMGLPIDRVMKHRRPQDKPEGKGR